MKKNILACLAGFILLCNSQNGLAQYTIPSTFFGVNGWMNNKIGNTTDVYDCKGLSATYSASPSPCSLNGNIDTYMTMACSTVIQNLHVSLIRYGGKANDINFPTRDQFITEIDRIRAIGAEPIIQIPYNDGAYTATDATNLLTYLNTTCGKKIKYVEIGNEPDLYPGYPTGGSYTDQDRANYIYNYFFSIASALKTVDNNIKIIGPSFSAYSPGVYSRLLTSGNPASLVDADIHGRYVLDIVDIHRYPFHGDANQTSNNIIPDPGNFVTVLTGSGIGLLDYISTANGTRSSPLQFSVSEMNIDYINPASNTYNGNGPNGFLAGQWLAEMYSVILDEARIKGVDVAFVSPWSLQEGGGTYDLGILDVTYACSTGVRSTYEHMAMMGKYFKGDFYKGVDQNSSGTDISDLKVFGTYLSGGHYAIMILNQGSTTYASYSINTSSTIPSSTYPLRIAMGMGTSLTYTYSSGIGANTTHLIVLDCTGTLVTHLKYDQTTEAQSHSDPTQVASNTGIVPLDLQMSATNTTCNSNTGSASVSATSGCTYSWSNGGSTSSISSLAAGQYSVTVHRTSGSCTGNYANMITVGKVSPSVTISPVNSCSGSQSFTASVAGGTSPYSYSWSGSGGTSATSSSYAQPGTANTANIYTVTVTDAAGCVNAAVCAHYANHSISISGTTSAGACCDITLTATYIPGASYTWKQNGSTLSGETSYILSGPYGHATYQVTAPTGSSDPCSAVSANYTVTAGGSDCDCPGSPRMANTFSANTNHNISSMEVVPNPASATTTINYTLTSNTSAASLIISNIFGQQINSFPLDTKLKSVELNCTDMADGIYFSTLITNGKIAATRKIVVAK